MLELGAMILVFWMLNFKPAFTLFFSPELRGSLVPLHFLPLEWYHLHIWGCWYFCWHSWFQLVIHPVLHFIWCILYVAKSRIWLSNWTELNSVCKLNKQGNNIQPCHTPFPILNQSVVRSPVLTVAEFWETQYRFLRTRLQELAVCTPISLPALVYFKWHSCLSTFAL